MLVLSRKTGETVLVGDRIKVSIIKLAGGKVRLGFEAPENVRILRSELEKWPEAPVEKSARAGRVVTN